MKKHRLELLIEKEAKTLNEIRDYLDKLACRNLENLCVYKWGDSDNYNLSFEFEVMNIISIDFDVTIGEIYIKSTNMHYNSIEEVIEQYIRERLSEEVKWLLDDIEGRHIKDRRGKHFPHEEEETL